ncbi:hypothetical protein [Pelagicoccus albus]|uniref:Uncharacterized protein n=1 Tax=Pelagicoccus albus TaxID=415222 RepID=A0A7X1B4R2_9BACT|nr:hypothetical protein [Pelagicoccus albus]MBC2605590.1 hypothetical protein [Pelagicoccus albus]
MNMKIREKRCWILLTICIIISNTLWSQSSVYCMQNGSWLPVYEVRNNAPYCFTGDSLVKADSQSLTMLASESFGHGFVEVEILENKRSGVIQNDQGLRFVTDKGRFDFVARVKATTDVEDLYCVMRFNKYGDAKFVCHRIGSLKRGGSSLITFSLQLKYEMPEQIHFYSGTEEIRSNLVPASYAYQFGDFLLASN